MALYTILFPCPRSCLIFWSRDVGSAALLTSLRPSSVSGANLVFTHRPFSCLPLSAAVPSFDAITVGTNGLTCGFNWQCIADVISYAVMITVRLDSLPSPHFHGLGSPRLGGSRGSCRKCGAFNYRKRDSFDLLR